MKRLLKALSAAGQTPHKNDDRVVYMKMDMMNRMPSSCMDCLRCNLRYDHERGKAPFTLTQGVRRSSVRHSKCPLVSIPYRDVVEKEVFAILCEHTGFKKPTFGMRRLTKQLLDKLELPRRH